MDDQTSIEKEEGEKVSCVSCVKTLKSYRYKKEWRTPNINDTRGGHGEREVKKGRVEVGG